MQKVVDGIQHFQKRVFRQQRRLFERLADGQRPEALFITCSDSRINPNLLTQTGPGDLFILRNAGNIVPPYGMGAGGEAATIEYAVATLGVTDVIVCGHSHCGAMSAVVDPSLTRDAPAVTEWLRYAEVTRRILRENYPHLSPKDQLNVAVQENVLAQVDNLQTHPSVAARLARGALQIHAWVYLLDLGEVYAYDPTQGMFLATHARGEPKALPNLLNGRSI